VEIIRRAVGLAAATCVLVVGAPALGQGPLTVLIDAPHAGIVEDTIVELRASVSDPTAAAATVTLNGASYHVPIEQGRIEQQLVTVPGNNRVGVVVSHGGQVARDSVTFRREGEQTEMVVLLTWPSRGEIIDLWVREPGGETCKWDHRQTEHGGRLLDFSTNAIGFGSQAYVLPVARAGRFRIKVHYWGAWGDDDERSSWTHTEAIETLDRLDVELAARVAPARRAELEAERRRTIERLDAWASPGAPQTPVHAEVVVFPGTRAERRFRFDVVTHRVGQLTTLGEVEIDDAMIRAARRDER
jgi:uncharacterized protein YfaP (DUF2135 family)